MIFILPLVQLCQQDIYAPFTYPVGDIVDSFIEMDDGSIILSYKEVVYQAYERCRITVFYWKEECKFLAGIFLSNAIVVSLFQKRSDPSEMRYEHISRKAF